jgi:GntR family transcriptional regulator, transcriptional repressor for pyruvate dehydrogenase complex
MECRVTADGIATDGKAPGDRRARATSVTDQVIEAVFDMLRSGQYRTGDRLPSEWELVEQLGVGRSAVREATRELAALGVVDVQPGRGTFVRSLRPDLLVRPDLQQEVDRALLREFLEVRQIIEPEAAALAATRATEAELERLGQDVERLAEAVNVGYRPPEDLGFHLNIVRATHNTALTRLAGAIVSFYQRDEALPSDRDVREHRAVLEAMRMRDPEAAKQAMHAHLSSETELRGIV